MEKDELADFYDEDDDYSLFNAGPGELVQKILEKDKEIEKEKEKEKEKEGPKRKQREKKEKEKEKDFIEQLKSIDFDLKNTSSVQNTGEYYNENEEYDSSEGEMSDSCCEKIKKLVGFEVDIRKKRKKKRKSLPPEIERKIGEANLHYTLREFNEAISLLHEVIKSKPNLPDPYQTLGLIYEEQNEMAKAIDLYMVAAFLSPKRDPFVWNNLASMSLEINDVHQAIYCLNKVIKRNSSDANAIWDKSLLLIQINEHKRAAESLHSLLKIRKGDSQATIELARLYFITLNNIPQAIDVLQSSIFATLAQDKLDMNVANMLMELYMVSGEYNKAIEVIKLLCKGKSPELDQFPLEIIVSYGICEAHIGNLDLAAKMFDHLLEQSPSRYSDLYYQVAETYLAIGECRKAITFYTSLLSDPVYNHPPIWIKLGRCEKRLHNYHAALMHYQSVYEVIPDEYEASMALCDIYRQNHMPEKALEVLVGNTEYLLKQNLMPDPRIIAEKAQLHLELHQEENYFESMALLFNHEFLRANKDFYPNQRKRNNQRRETDLFSEDALHSEKDEDEDDDDDSDSDDDDDEEDYEGIPPPPPGVINNNQSNVNADTERVLTLKNKKTRKRIAKRGPTQPGILSLVGEDRFFSLIVNTIKKLFVDKNYDKISEILDSVLSNVNFTNDIRKNQLRRLLIAVALSRGDSDLSFNQIRTMCKEFPYCIRIWQLFSLVISKDSKPDRAQKILIRLEEKYPDSLPIKIMIGHLYSISGNLALALSAYYKVYQSAPNDPFVNLYISLVYLGQVMNRKLANRHFCVIQSFAHLYQYYQHRSSKHEANYNMGRAFQQLGLNHLAVVYYERALAEHKNDKLEKSDLTREIAYNLSLIYKESGSPELARQLLLEYLCF